MGLNYDFKRPVPIVLSKVKRWYILVARGQYDVGCIGCNHGPPT